MTIISRYIMRQIAAPSFLALAVVAFLTIAGKLGGQKLQVELITSFDVLRLALYLLPSLIVFVFPITYLIGVLLAFGRLTQTNEIAAMRASGISLARILTPVIGTGCLLMAACFVILDYVQPWAIRQAYRIQFQELPLRLTLDALSPGVMHNFGDWRIYFRAKDNATRTLYDVDILAPEKDGRSMLYFARVARVVSSGSRWSVEMDNANMATSGKNNVALVRVTGVLPVPEIMPPQAKRDRLIYSLGELFQVERLTRLAKDMGAGWTQSVVESIQNAGGDVTKAEAVPELLRRKYPMHATIDLDGLSSLLDTGANRFNDSLKETREEIGKRFAMPLACVSITLAGVALTLRTQHGARSHSYAIGVAIVFAYYAMGKALEAGGLHSLPNMVVRSLAPNLVFLAFSFILLRRADRP